MHRRSLFGLLLGLGVLPAVYAFAQDRGEHCRDLEKQEHDLNDQLDHERDDRQRQRLQEQIRQVRDQMAHDCR